MEVTVLGVVVLLVVIWYLGSTVNKLVIKADVILDKSSDMATDEFESFRKDQKIRLHKTRIAQSKTLDGLQDETCYSNDEFDSIFNVMKGSDTTEDKEGK